MTTAAPRAHKMRLAVLTSGGDSAGMNAVVRAVVKMGIIRYVPLFLLHFLLCLYGFCFSPLLSLASLHPTYYLFEEDARRTSSEKGTKVSFVETPKPFLRRRPGRTTISVTAKIRYLWREKRRVLFII